MLRSNRDATASSSSALATSPPPPALSGAEVLPAGAVRAAPPACAVAVVSLLLLPPLHPAIASASAAISARAADVRTTRRMSRPALVISPTEYSGRSRGRVAKPLRRRSRDSRARPATSGQLRRLELRDHRLQGRLVLRRPHRDRERRARRDAAVVLQHFRHELVVRRDRAELLEHVVRD